ncbi:MAG: OmpA family protein [Prevotellaceae bacterium]|jgi:outer membrane protein OmpA-like peptidoglycan-associated protein|nr:OmpA family protein [Prevotellaceae bacterium]
MTNLNKLIVSVAAILVAISAGAQSSHQFSINAGGGLSTLKYEPVEGENKTGFGGTLGLDYTLFFNPKWGISTGLGVALFNAKYELPSLREVNLTAFDDFQCIAITTGYSEKQQAALLTVPLMLRFESGKFYAAAGAKIGIPVKATNKNKLNEFQLRGYYPSDDWYDDDPESGFGTLDGFDGKGDLKLKTAFFASVEAGIKWGKLYTGIYFDYGFNNSNKTQPQRQKLIPYTPLEFVNDEYIPPKMPSTVNSVLTASIDNKRIVDKVTPLAAGIKIAFVIHRSKPKVKTVEPVETQPAFDAQAEAERQRLAEEDARRKAELREAEERRRAEEARKLEERRKAEEARKLEQQRQYDADMAILVEPVGGFAINSVIFTDLMKTELDKKAEILVRYPNMNIQIEGHACDMGNNAVNMKLGLRRADAVKEYFVAKGIAANRITTASKGKTEPIAPNTNEENRRKNRRIQIKNDN